jgi:hypothetical protein
VKPEKKKKQTKSEIVDYYNSAQDS